MATKSQSFTNPDGDMLIIKGSESGLEVTVSAKGQQSKFASTDRNEIIGVSRAAAAAKPPEAD